MQIKTQETVQKTLDKYRWDDLENWNQSGQGKERTFSRSVYTKKDLTVVQKKWCDGQCVCVETPSYTLHIGTGYHLNLNSFHPEKQSKYYVLSVSTTMGEKKIYQSIVDESGFKNIQGDRRYLFHFMENLPDRYLVLDVDEKAPYISTYWMNPHRIFTTKRFTKRMGKGARE